MPVEQTQDLIYFYSHYIINELMANILGEIYGLEKNQFELIFVKIRIREARNNYFLI